MAHSAVVVFTSKDSGTLIAQAGSSCWALRPERARSREYVVCTWNERRAVRGEEEQVAHGAAFLIGRVSDVVPCDRAPLPDRKNLTGWCIKFDKYARINVPDAWPRHRQPVAYVGDVEHLLGLRLDALDWQSLQAAAASEPTTLGNEPVVETEATASSTPPVLVCRTAWMDRYQGLRKGADPPKGGGAYVGREGFGHEIFNFLRDDDGSYRGYVRPPGQRPVAEQRINIGRLGATRDSDAARGVTIFWAATHPVLGGTRVVGWYDDAVVYRNWKPSPKPRVLPNAQDAGFMIEARSGKLLPKDDRSLVLPRGEGGMGQANIWYPSEDWAKRLLEHRNQILAGTASPATRKPARPGRNGDTEERLRVERMAMEAVERWCDARDLEWEDVSLAKIGWDIEAGQGLAVLRIEVKGSSAPIGAALLELTPNEYLKMTSEEHRESFRLAVVSVQGEKTALVMFSWSREGNEWIADTGGYSLRLHEFVGARVEIVVDQG